MKDSKSKGVGNLFTKSLFDCIFLVVTVIAFLSTFLATAWVFIYA